MLVAGLMSGTSVDGIDVALVEITGEGFGQKIRTKAHCSIPFQPEVRKAVLSVCNAPTHTARLSQLNFLLGELFGMRGSRRRLALVKGGRLLPIDLPFPYPFQVTDVGWLADEGPR